jgi:prevent-host-death family protein
MNEIQVSDFKAKFSDIIKHVQEDQAEYVIQYGRKHKKVAVLIPYEQYLDNRPKIKLGLLEGKGKLEIKDNFEMDEDTLLGLS